MVQQREVKDWITVNGKHVPIFEGESRQDAYNRSVAKANEDIKEQQIKDRADQVNRMNNSEYAPQIFKLVHSSINNKRYESELFKIDKYTHNSPNTSWKESGYELGIKNQAWLKERQKFSTLKEAKAFANSDEGKEWYFRNKKDKSK